MQRSSVDVNGRLPDNAPFGISDHAVSWGVKLLPYLGYADLFDEYHFDRSWSSRVNARLMRDMPRVFGLNGTETRIKAFTGPETSLTGEPAGLESITDDLSKTVFAISVDPDQAVPWAKPIDIVLDSERPLQQLGSTASRGIEALFFDGQVSTLPPDIDAETLWRLVNPRDGKPVDLQR